MLSTRVFLTDINNRKALCRLDFLVLLFSLLIATHGYFSLMSSKSSQSTVCFQKRVAEKDILALLLTFPGYNSGLNVLVNFAYSIVPAILLWCKTTIYITVFRVSDCHCSPFSENSLFSWVYVLFIAKYKGITI